MALENTDHYIDLSGDVCPFTFVKSKLEIEKLQSGQTLGIKVDNGESASNVPRSFELEGHEVLSVDTTDGGWLIVIKKS